MRYEIRGDSLPVVICNLEEGEQMVNQGGAMSWMTPNMQMSTEGGGGLGKALGRMFAGEKIFRNVYTAVGGPGMIAFSSSFPGSIVAVEVTPGHPVILQKSAFLAATPGLESEVFFNRKAATGFFGGEGFIMQKWSGSGLLFLEVDGAAVEYELGAGETMVVSTGDLAMMDATCTMDVQTVKGVKNVLFGGEGLFLTYVTGPGHITLQTMNAADLAGRLAPYLVSSNK